MKNTFTALVMLSAAIALVSCGNNSDNASSSSKVEELTVSTAISETTVEVTTTTTATTTSATPTAAYTILKTTETVTTTAEPETTTIIVEPDPALETVLDIPVFSYFIPANMIEDTDDALEKAEADENIVNYVLNSDGSITYTVTEEYHNKMLADYIDSFDEKMKSKIEADCQVITDIEHNDDLTEFTIYVTDEESYRKSFESFVIISLEADSYFYNILDGKTLTTDDISFIYIDNSTGEEFTK